MAVKITKTNAGLRDELFNMFSDLRNGTIDLKEAAETNNTAGKIINSYKIESEAYALMKLIPKKEDLKFLTS